ncbi:MAG: hypothetical protein Q9228_007933 [Teloschistes exilis]
MSPRIEEPSAGANDANKEYDSPVSGPATSPSGTMESRDEYDCQAMIKKVNQAVEALLKEANLSKEQLFSYDTHLSTLTDLLVQKSRLLVQECQQLNGISEQVCSELREVSSHQIIDGVSDREAMELLTDMLAYGKVLVSLGKPLNTWRDALIEFVQERRYFKSRRTSLGC